MDVKLLKQLLPGEINEFYVRNEIRADGRELRHHRKYYLAREVLHCKSQDSLEQKVSCSVKLGSTHILCSLVISSQAGSVLVRSEP